MFERKCYQLETFLFGTDEADFATKESFLLHEVLFSLDLDFCNLF